MRRMRRKITVARMRGKKKRRLVTFRVVFPRHWTIVVIYLLSLLLSLSLLHSRYPVLHLRSLAQQQTCHVVLHRMN